MLNAEAVKRIFESIAKNTYVRCCSLLNHVVCVFVIDTVGLHFVSAIQDADGALAQHEPA